MSTDVPTPPAATEAQTAAHSAAPSVTTASRFDGKTVLRECGDYAEAQRVVDALSDDGFPVENLTILGEGLASVEQVVGSLSWGKVILQGLLGGGLNGLLIALIFSFFGIMSLESLLALLAYGFVIGAVLGVIFRSVAYAATGGNRDFQSVRGMQASRYLVLVADDHAADAEGRLAGQSL